MCRRRFLAWSAGVLTLPTAAGTFARGVERSFTEGRLWRISRQGGADSFAFGTIHVADPRVSEIPPPVAGVFAGTRVFAFELAPVEVVHAQAYELEELPEARRLEPLIGPEAFAQLSDELFMTGTPRRVIAHLKPWAAMMRLASSHARDDTRSLEENLLAAARARRIQWISLESIEEQIAAFDTIPLDSQVALLKHTLANRDVLARVTESSIAAWQRGDLAALAAITEQVGREYPGMAPHYAQLTRHLVVNRTVLMHHRLRLPLRGGRVLAAVGALHLFGQDGLLAMLARDGYRVSKVW